MSDIQARILKKLLAGRTLDEALKESQYRINEISKNKGRLKTNTFNGFSNTKLYSYAEPKKTSDEFIKNFKAEIMNSIQKMKYDGKISVNMEFTITLPNEQQKSFVFDGQQLIEKIN